jgi:beta-lactamase class D
MLNASFSPCSSFKVPLALMGYDSGILKDETTPVWDYSPEYDPHCLMMLENWKKPYNPSMWMQNSCVWYSQCVTRALGMERFQAYVDGFGYGNRDLSGGILRAWLTTSLVISLREQVEFFRKLAAGQLPVSAQAMAMTKRLIASGACAGGELFGKTGSGYIDIDKGLQRGWYAGWLEKKGQKYLFAALNDHAGPGYAGLQVKEFMKGVLERLFAGKRHADSAVG